MAYLLLRSYLQSWCSTYPGGWPGLNAWLVSRDSASTGNTLLVLEPSGILFLYLHTWRGVELSGQPLFNFPLQAFNVASSATTADAPSKVYSSASTYTR